MQLNKYQQMLVSLSTRLLCNRLPRPYQADSQGNPPSLTLERPVGHRISQVTAFSVTVVEQPGIRCLLTEVVGNTNHL